MRYDLTAQAWRSFVAPGELSFFNELTFGLDGNLYVSGLNADQNSLIARYDGQTGAYLDTLVSPGSGGWSYPGSLGFGPPFPTAEEPRAIPEPGTPVLLTLPTVALALLLRRRSGGHDRRRQRVLGERA